MGLIQFSDSPQGECMRISDISKSQNYNNLLYIRFNNVSVQYFYTKLKLGSDCIFIIWNSLPPYSVFFITILNFASWVSVFLMMTREIPGPSLWKNYESFFYIWTFLRVNVQNLYYREDNRGKWAFRIALEMNRIRKIWSCEK